MTKYNFNEAFNRRDSDSEKWNEYDSDTIPMWIADSDYAVSPNIIKALQSRLEHPVLGYGEESKKLRNLIKDRMKSLYNWDIELDWICFTPGVVASLNVSRAISGKNGDEVITALPTYPHLQNHPVIIDRKMTFFNMVNIDGRYTPDFTEMDSVITDKTSLMLLGNPHNPVGTVYSEQELKSYAQRAIDNDIIICSDEIHADLILDKSLKHKPIATLSAEIEQRTITLMAASKTFNIAGLNCSYAIIANDKLRNSFKTELKGLVGGVNILGYVASEAAYKHGDEWLKEQLGHLNKNMDYCYKRINSIDGLSMNKMEATYLAWVDTTKLSDKLSAKGYKNAYELFLSNCVALTNGDAFGNSKFVRINLACGLPVLETALSRIEKAVKSL